MRQGGVEVVGHWPRRSPFSRCSPRLVSTPRSAGVRATLSASNRSTAASKSNPRNRFGFSFSHTLRLALFAQDRITAETYYAVRQKQASPSLIARHLPTPSPAPPRKQPPRP